MLTTYEMVIQDTAAFRGVQWEAMVLDEGHRLKAGPHSRGFEALEQLDVRHRVLLTGTPLQNNLEELFHLLHFLRRDLFPSFEAFQQRVSGAGTDSATQVANLKSAVAPHMFRRVKKDVLDNIPPRRELHVPVELSPLQCEYYRAMLTKNYTLLAGNAAKAARGTRLHNMVVQLRKVANHPYLIEGTEPHQGVPEKLEALRVAASGKLQLLDQLLVKLRERGHRVLIFSQMRKMLDVLEDYTRSKFGQESYERVDGAVLAAARQGAILRFNAKDSPRWIFLLSTRACGLGINLATADTVVIFDSDWNPHADVQAMSRAHRIGQTKAVAVFRLITRGTVEERILTLAKRKMALDHVFRGNAKSSGESTKLLQDILKWGAQELFEAGEGALQEEKPIKPIVSIEDQGRSWLRRGGLRREPRPTAFFCVKVTETAHLLLAGDTDGPESKAAAEVAAGGRVKPGTTADLMAKYGACLENGAGQRGADGGAEGATAGGGRKRLVYDEAAVLQLLDQGRAAGLEDAAVPEGDGDEGGLGSLKPQAWTFDDEGARHHHPPPCAAASPVCLLQAGEE